MILSPSGLQEEVNKDKQSKAEAVKNDLLEQRITKTKVVEKPVEISTEQELTEEEADWLYNNLRQITEKYNSNTLSDSIDYTLKTPLKLGDTTVTAIEPSAGSKSYIWFEKGSTKWLISIDEKKGKQLITLLKINDKGTYYAEKLSQEDIKEFIKEADLTNLIDSIYEDTNVEKPESRRDQFEVQNKLQQKYGLKRTYKDIYNEFNKTTVETPIETKPVEKVIVPETTGEVKAIVPSEQLITQIQSSLPKQDEVSTGVETVKKLIEMLIPETVKDVVINGGTLEGTTVTNSKGEKFTVSVSLLNEESTLDTLQTSTGDIVNGKIVNEKPQFTSDTDLLKAAVADKGLIKYFRLELVNSEGKVVGTIPQLQALQEKFNEISLETIENYITFAEGDVSIAMPNIETPIEVPLEAKEEVKAEEAAEVCAPTRKVKERTTTTKKRNLR
jgi:hypothetical protein